MTFLDYIQKQQSDQYELYVPQVICDSCGNDTPGDDPAIHVQECHLCEQLGEKNNDSRHNSIRTIRDIFLGNV